jgi:hypothetical protein
LPQQAMQIERASGLGSGTGFALAAERLDSYHCADHVAVDINVAGTCAGRDEINGLVDPAVHAERESVAGRINVPDQISQPAAGEAHDMQHRTKHLSFQFADATNLDQSRRYKNAIHANRRQR